MIRTKRCGRCEPPQQLPATTEFFYVRGYRKDGEPRLDGYCKECRKDERMRIYWSDPQTHRREMRERRGERRATEPGFIAAEAAHQQAYRARVKRNKARRERHRQAKRIQARLAAERQGVTFSNRVVPADVKAERGIGTVRAEPVAAFVSTLRVQLGGWVAVGELVGMDEAQVRAVGEGRRSYLHAVVADEIFTRAGRPDLFASHYN